MSANTDLMQLVTAPTKWPPARLLTTQWMRDHLLLNVAGRTSVLALVGRCRRRAWGNGQTVWKRLSEISMEGYVHTYAAVFADEAITQQL